ncbi:hypothetical protein [Myroides profundi]|uniref:Uncharacterized protein n=1 Tax=Myroides profundi TaxID=480520 RepID=A0AAJ4W741_MYRPR|nr:hypothetical protein [Myroides profundi]AJH15273.1 hypothetical protein MPR_2102 [Myroides profundi]SER66736.1 hypothetical protein SAMN04488089_12515 [Myroides profundi]
MKKYLSILFLFLSFLVTASPVIEWSCTEEVMTCGMEMSTEGGMSCCGGDMEQSSRSMDMNMPCCTVASRVLVTIAELKVQTPKVVQDTKAKIANIKSQWFNSNYLEDLKSIDLVSVSPLSVSVSGFKYKDIDPLSYICIYRI